MEEREKRRPGSATSGLFNGREKGTLVRMILRDFFRAKILDRNAPIWLPHRMIKAALEKINHAQGHARPRASGAAQ